MKTIIVYGIICSISITASEVGFLKTHETKTHKTLEAKLRDIKHITEESNFVNNTLAVQTDPKNVVYEKWSNWSKCRSCRRTRKRKCVSKICKFSTLYEEKPCGRPRCKRKNKKKTKINVIENIESTKSLKPQLKNWQKYDEEWSNWSVCSNNCTTRRYKLCRKPEKCPKRRIEQHAYCFIDGSRCERWIQNIIDDYDRRVYDVPTTTTTTKKPEYKKRRRGQRKCGIMYKNFTGGISTNMLRIIGGVETYKSKWPWHVALMNRFKEVFCGGTLISPRWILTAAHCVRHMLYASLNEYDISYDDGTEMQYRIAKSYVHPRFNALTIDNDIALLRLPKAVPVPFACLPTEEPVVGSLCTVMGWGKRKMNDFRGSKRLREAELPVVSKDVCLRSYRRYRITENMFCAGYRGGGTDTCSGDSGGGLLCPRSRKGWVVNGITSFGEGCGKRGKYGIYVAVNNYLDWIKSVIENK